MTHAPQTETGQGIHTWDDYHVHADQAEKAVVEKVKRSWRVVWTWCLSTIVGIIISLLCQFFTTRWNWIGGLVAFAWLWLWLLHREEV